MELCLGILVRAGPSSQFPFIAPVKIVDPTKGYRSFLFFLFSPDVFSDYADSG